MVGGGGGGVGYGGFGGGSEGGGAGLGAAIFTMGAVTGQDNVTITNCTFTANTASGGSGARARGGVAEASASSGKHFSAVAGSHGI